MGKSVTGGSEGEEDSRKEGRKEGGWGRRRDYGRKKRRDDRDHDCPSSPKKGVVCGDEKNCHQRGKGACREDTVAAFLSCVLMCGLCGADLGLALGTLQLARCPQDGCSRADATSSAARLYFSDNATDGAIITGMLCMHACMFIAPSSSSFSARSGLGQSR